MTLITFAFNKSAIYVATDTQLTYIGDRTIAEQAIKSNFFQCKDGKFLVGYTGNNVYITDELHLADWITDRLSGNNIATTEIASIIATIKSGLEEAYYYRRAPFEPLTIVAVGWVRVGDKTELVGIRITNCEAEDASSLSPSRAFKVFKDELRRDALVRGSIRLKVYPAFDNKLKHIRSLLKSYQGDKIALSLYELNSEARANPEWRPLIGEDVVISCILRDENRVRHWQYPLSEDYLVPNSNTGNLSLRGVRVTGDSSNGSLYMNFRIGE
ncbi:MAG TPA: hypothetical protein VF466_04490 [Candidatus Saccharimonadales bacterium]